MDGRYLRGLRISGSGFSGQLEQMCDGITFSMAIDKITQMSFGFADNYTLDLFRSRLMDRGATISYGEWQLSVDSVDLGSSDAGPHLDVSALSTFVTKWQRQHGAKTWTNVDVTQWFIDMCRSVGAQPVVQPGLGRRTIVRESSLEGGFQDSWEVMSQTKRELGLWMFERGKQFVVGKPSWIMRQNGIFREWSIFWNSWYDYSEALTGMPQYTGRNDKRDQETLKFELVSKDADTIRPGDRVRLGGSSQMSGDWLVADVGFPMTNVKPVAVSCLRPVDPPKEETSGQGGLGSTAAEWAAAPSQGVATSVSRATISLSNLPTSVAGFTGQQLVNAAHIIRAGQRMKLPKRAAQIALMAAIGESSLRSLPYGSSAKPSARGIFQLPDTAPWPEYSDRMDVPNAARAFYDELLKVTNYTTIEPSVAAHLTLNSPSQYEYRPYWSAAVKIVDAIIATTTNSGGVATGGTIPAELVAAVDRYVNAVLGRPLDYDLVYGAQCVDLTQHYTVAMGGPRIWGNGRDWWNNGRASNFYNGIAANGTPRKGDIACWNNTMGGGWGHVAIVLEDLGATVRCVSQNPGPPTIVNLTKNGLDGYLRPKRWK